MAWVLMVKCICLGKTVMVPCRQLPLTLGTVKEVAPATIRWAEQGTPCRLLVELLRYKLIAVNNKCVKVHVCIHICASSWNTPAMYLELQFE